MGSSGLTPISAASSGAAGITTLAGEFFGLGIYALFLAAEKEAETRGLKRRPETMEAVERAVASSEESSVLCNFEFFADQPPRYKTLAPEIAEIVGARLARAVSIGAPKGFRVVSADEARALDPAEYVFKAWKDGRIKVALPGQAERFFACQKIPEAISLHWLAEQHGIKTGCPISELTET